MSGAGRPLRFLGVVLGGWAVVRVALLWPQIDSLPSLASALIPPVAAATRPFEPSADLAPARSPTVAPPEGPPPTPRATASPAAVPPVSASAPAPHIPAARSPPSSRTAVPSEPPPLRPAPIATPPGRWALSAWLIARGGERGAVSGGQLGASQAGARLTYRLGRRVAFAARVSAPVEGRGKEAALGLDWQPTALPIHLVAEQRFALDGGRGGPTLFLIGGIDPTPVALGFRLDAYGQAGGILRDGRADAFADGAARLLHPLASLGRARLEIGGGAWGGAQRGAARLDVGPSAALVVPLSRRNVRFALDWRQRVAGRARPGSGPALSIGGDF